MNIGQTYSTSDYKLYEETGDKNHFEEVIDKLMIDEYLSTEEKEYINSLPTNKKRRAIFILINEKSQFVLEELLDINKETTTKDKLRTTIEAINKYIEVGHKEVKKYGEVFTPLSLVDDMLDTLPNDVWSNPNLKWLDPANGIGNFPIRIIKRLMVGLKKEIPNTRKRYKHIIENMLYTCDLQPRNVFTYLFLVDPLDEHTTNIYTGSFLDEGFDRHMKDVWEVDKFDIVVGNPPYNQTIDLKFLEKSYHISNQILFVHPSTWLIDEKNKQRKFLKAKELVKDDLKSVRLFNGNPIFGIGLFVPCSITHIDKSYTGVIKMHDKINSRLIEYDDIFKINKYNTPEYESLKDKISNLGDYIPNYLNRSLKYWVNLSQIRGHVNTRKSDDLSIVKDDFYTLCPRALLVSDSKRKQREKSQFSFETKTEANNFLSYIKTKIARFCFSLLKNNANCYCGEFNLIPWLDFTQEWTDEKLRKEFNITDKEWEFIESVIPDYY